MGQCCGGSSKENADMTQLEKLNSTKLDEEMRNDHLRERNVNKLLLLGAGESGKSTLFKQMITIYGEGFSETERRTYLPIIYTNIFTAMKTLCHQVEHYGKLGEAAEEARQILEEEIMDGEAEDSWPEMGKHVGTLWKDPAIQETYKQRAKFQLTDSAAYFFDKIDQIQEDYIPTEQDVLRSRVRTTGIVENTFEIDGNKFRMFDVGGQRNERKKWIHCFEGVTAVIFVAAISEYDQVLYEDETTNRLMEALNLFQEICNSRWFKTTSMILFLNKRDLFEDKIKQVSLKQCFPEYDGGNSYEDGVQFLKTQFESQNNQRDEKLVYTHVTCATDTGNISAVFNAVKDIIIRDSLREAGLLT